jgi:hypothetical protein
MSFFLLKEAQMANTTAARKIVFWKNAWRPAAFGT